MKNLRAAMIGDVVGEPGLEVLEGRLPVLVKEHGLDFTVVNGENAADGFGITEAVLKRIIAAGADVVTSGNHVWEKREFWPALDAEERILRPANYPPGVPGQGQVRIEKNGVSWIVINLQGREFMNPIDCPFRCFDAILKMHTSSAGQSHHLMDLEGMGLPTVYPIVLVDFHAESAREKEALAYYIDGQASAAAGTHTHVQTADERVLPKGTAYITDLGMTGIVDSVIGMDPKICLERMRKQVLYRMEPARLPNAGQAPGGKSGSAPAAGTAAAVKVQGVIVEIDPGSGKAVSIQRI